MERHSFDIVSCESPKCGDKKQKVKGKKKEKTLQLLRCHDFAAMTSLPWLRCNGFAAMALASLVLPSLSTMGYVENYQSISYSIRTFLYWLPGNNANYCPVISKTIYVFCQNQHYFERIWDYCKMKELK